MLYEAGVRVPRGRHVHHINGDKQDNRLENLVVLTAKAHHVGHAVERGYVDNQHGRWPPRLPRSCERCGEEFIPHMHKSRFCSRSCANRRHQ